LELVDVKRAAVRRTSRPEHYSPELTLQVVNLLNSAVATALIPARLRRQRFPRAILPELRRVLLIRRLETTVHGEYSSSLARFARLA
jgi:hypothetical protein